MGHLDLQTIALLSITGITIGCIYALISLGFNVIYRTTGVINFAQGEFVMVGGIAAAWADTHLVEHNIPGHLLWALLIGALIAAGVGALLETLAIRPVRAASPVMQIIVTIGASIVLRAAASLIWGTEPFHLPVLKEGSLSIGGTNIDYQSLLIVPVAAACMLLLTLFFRNTAAGRAMRATAENREAARLCGVHTGRMSFLSFAISGLLGGIGGIMVTPILSMSFDRGTMLGLKGFAAATLGGLGNPVGGIIGGILMGVLEQYSCWFSSAYKDILALAIVVVILLVRPRGLLTK
ncbi:MAG: branched-chain amino acid ABC transporter permease [Armatimonadota bacterium]